eukprot:6190357-Pleurochrysis_carterae.AAC.3
MLRLDQSRLLGGAAVLFELPLRLAAAGRSENSARARPARRTRNVAVGIRAEPLFGILDDLKAILNAMTNKEFTINAVRIWFCTYGFLGSNLVRPGLVHMPAWQSLGKLYDHFISVYVAVAPEFAFPPMVGTYGRLSARAIVRTYSPGGLSRAARTVWRDGAAEQAGHASSTRACPLPGSGGVLHTEVLWPLLSGGLRLEGAQCARNQSYMASTQQVEGNAPMALAEAQVQASSSAKNVDKVCTSGGNPNPGGGIRTKYDGLVAIRETNNPTPAAVSAGPGPLWITKQIVRRPLVVIGCSMGSALAFTLALCVGTTTGALKTKIDTSPDAFKIQGGSICDAPYTQLDCGITSSLNRSARARTRSTRSFGCPCM